MQADQSKSRVEVEQWNDAHLQMVLMRIDHPL